MRTGAWAGRSRALTVAFPLRDRLIDHGQLLRESVYVHHDQSDEAIMLLLHRLQARDRALYEVLVLPSNSQLKWRAAFTFLTHAGGARATVLATLAPLALPEPWYKLGVHALLTLVSSHLIVQLAKRLVGRDRPSRSGIGRVFLVEPDQFSFPSGHATASMAVALAYAAVFPMVAVPLLLLAMIVGISRVALGVHYPGDVAAGQALAVATHLALVAFGA